MAYLRIVCAFVLILGAGVSAMRGQLITETEILGGMEKILRYDMDTTYNWWAITEPFEGKERLTVNSEQSGVYDKVSDPVFSPNGKLWITFGIKNEQWYIVTNFYQAPVEYNFIEKAQFTRDSRHVFFVGWLSEDPRIVKYKYIFENDEDFRLVYENETQAPDIKGELLINRNGTKVGYIGARNGGESITFGTDETTIFDSIFPIGFWNDNSFLYAAGIGEQWRLYRDNEVLSSTYVNIREALINEEGTNAVIIASQQNGDVAVLFSEEYTEPLIGATYDAASNLALHPTLPLYAYNAFKNLQNLIVYVGAEYIAGERVSPPYFTYDGSTLSYIACNTDCAININGESQDLQMDFDIERRYCLAPRTNTFCFASSTSLVVKDYVMNKVFASSIMDELGFPRYNRFDNKYQLLGRISERLYLLEYEF